MQIIPKNETLGADPQGDPFDVLPATFPTFPSHPTKSKPHIPPRSKTFPSFLPFFPPPLHFSGQDFSTRARITPGGTFPCHPSPCAEASQLLPTNGFPRFPPFPGEGGKTPDSSSLFLDLPTEYRSALQTLPRILPGFFISRHPRLLQVSEPRTPPMDSLG